MSLLSPSIALKDGGQAPGTPKGLGGVAAKSWIIWACAGLFYFYEMVLRASPGVITHDLMRDFAVSAGSLGLLTSFYYYSYVALQVPCGVIVDWLGARRVVTFSALLCVVGSFMFALSDSLFVAQAARFLIGAGSACAFLSCLKIGSDWFLASQFALIAGLTNMMGTVGGCVSGPPFAYLANNWGWRQATLFAAVFGLGLAALCWVVIRDPKKQTASEEIKGSTADLLLSKLHSVASVPRNWIVGIVGGLMYVPISAFCELWGVPFLMQRFDVDNETASFASIMIYAGIAVGSPLMVLLSDYLKSRIKVISLSAMLTAIVFSVVTYLDMLSYSVILGLLFVAGVLNSGQILCFAAIKETMPNSMSGTSVGFTNALVMLSGIIFQPFLGLLLDIAWQGDFNEDGTRFYSGDAYQIAMIAIPVCFFISWLLMNMIASGEKRVEAV